MLRSIPTSVWYLLAIFVLLACGYHALCVYGVSHPVAIEKEDSIVTSAEAIADEGVLQLQVKIDKILEKGLSDECPGVAKTIGNLKARLAKGNVCLTVEPEATGMRATTTLWRKGVPYIVFYGPVVEQILPSCEDEVGGPSYEMMVGAICHEELFIELAPKEFEKVKFESPGGQKLYRKGEAAVWAKQIIEITEPMLKAGRYVDGQSARAALNFQKCGRANNQQWKEWVTQNLCATQL